MSITAFKTRRFGLALLGVMVAGVRLSAATTQPLVAVHDSEYTRALATMPATSGVPTGTGTTGYQWWPTNWNYFVMPDAVEEALNADGTAYTVVTDKMISNGALLNAQGTPAYPIVISLAAEATANAEVTALTNYVAAGGFLFVGSSAFTRNTDGSSRGNFAFATQLGVSMVNSGLQNWTLNSTFKGVVSHQLISHIPSGTALTWQMPSAADEISWQKPYHLVAQSPSGLPHMLWEVKALDAQVLATGDAYPYILIKPYGKGYFIYDAALQPLVGHGSWAPGMYAYGIFRNAIQWAFQSASVPVAKLSPWPYAYNAAVIFRHDGEAIPYSISGILGSIEAESAKGAHGDYFFCTGALREDFGSSQYAATLASLQTAASTYGATIASHNGGLTNINPAYNPPLPEIEKVFSQVSDWYTGINPYENGVDDPPLIPYDYDYWHWGPDEFLDLPSSVLPSGTSYGNVTNYAATSIGNSLNDINGWGLNSSGLRIWVAPYFNATRDASYAMEKQLGIVSAGEQKLSPFPHWTLSTATADYLYPILTLPVSDWFVGTQIGQAMETGHTQATMQALVDYYYSIGTLINLYSHSSSAGNGAAGALATEYLTYSLAKPLIWSANTESIYNWWVQRSGVTVTPSFTVNGGVSVINLAVSGATSANTAVEVLLPGTGYTELQVLLNGAPAGSGSYRTNGAIVKVLVGTTVSNVQISYAYATLPVVVDSQYVVAEGTVLTVGAPGVLTNATNPGSVSLTASAVTQPANGTLALNSNGSFTYTPNAYFSGQDSFEFVAYDGVVDSLPATAAITVTPSSGVLFSDTFPGTSLSPFVEESGTWSVANNVLSGTCPVGGYGYVYVGETWTNYSVQAQLTFPSGAWGGGIGGRLNTATGAHYAAWVYPEGSGGGSAVLKLIKFEGWTTWGGTPMAVANLTSVGTTSHTLLMTFHGATITVSYDGTQEISVTDNNFDSVAPFASGGITVDMSAYPGAYTLAVQNVIVTGAVAPPVANNDSYSMAAGTTLSEAAPGVLANDTGGSGTLSAVLASNAAHGYVILNSSGSFTYTNAGGFTGTDTFTYEATDGVNLSSPATVSITVTPLAATADSYSMVQAGTLTVGSPGVLSNDQGGGTGLKATLVTGVAHGSLTLNSNGSFTYTPVATFTGTDSFTYTASDAAGDVSAAVAVSLVVTAEQPPVANNDSYSVAEGSVLTVAAPGVLANDTGGSGTLTATLATGPSDGTLSLNSNGSFTYTPKAGFSGMDTFTYTATDGLTTSSAATVTITVTASAALFTDTFPGTTLSPFVQESGTWSVANNILSATSTKGANGYAYYNASGWSSYAVQASIRFSITNGSWGGGIGGQLNATTGAHYGAWVYPEGSGGGSAVLKLIKFESWTGWSGTPMALASLTKGVGTNWHTLVLSFQGANITVSYDGSQVISVTDNNFDGIAPYTTGGITADMATYPTAYTFSVSNVVVTAISTAPVANNDSYSVQENTALTVVAPGVLGNDTGGSGTLTATEVKGPASGTLTLNSNGSFTYTPNTGFSGTDSFTYTATDGVNTSAPATVTITVTSTSGVLFSDTFPGTSLSPFVTESGTWSVANNVLSGTCAVYGYGYAYLSTNWTDYSVQAQLTFPAGAWGGGIGGRLNATTGAHYGVWVYPENSGGGSAVVKVIKFEGWTTWGGTAMATANVTSVGTTAHTLLVSFQGSTITVSYDGTQEISVTDNNFDSVAAYTSGGITVDMSAYPAAYTMSVQDVVVQSLP
jgi:VCBS repeat-containing protein